eukprot:131047-Pelagomonas_calceolata.AAC.6
MDCGAALGSRGLQGVYKIFCCCGTAAKNGLWDSLGVRNRDFMQNRLWDSISRGVESVLGCARCGTAGHKGYKGKKGLSQDHSGSLHAGLVTQELQLGVLSRWMPESDVMELPDAAALCPSVYEHMRKDRIG